MNPFEASQERVDAETFAQSLPNALPGDIDTPAPISLPFLQPAPTVLSTPLSVPGPARFDSIPTPLTHLIGREEEVERLTTLLLQPGVRLLTLSGTGGVGKTRLALAVAHHLHPAFPDGVVFVDLSAIRDPALVALTMAHSLGLPEREGSPPLRLHTLSSERRLAHPGNFCRMKPPQTRPVL